MNRKIDNGTIIRTAVLFFALLNQLLIAAGYSPLPFSDADVELVVSTLITGISAIVAWWYNNDLTRQARRDAAMLEREKDMRNKPQI